MISYSQTSGVFTPHMLKSLTLAKRYVGYLPNKIGKRVTRCHEVARVVAEYLDTAEDLKGLKIEIYDGHYGPMEHSWLVLRDRFKGATYVAVLDTYAVGRLPQVQLVSTSVGHALLYEAGDPRKDIRKTDMKKMREHASKTHELRAFLANL